MKLALGPLLYFWPREQVFDFYRAAAHWPVATVYLGEVVCGKRRTMTPEAWLEIADLLAAAGKEVVLSTMALVEAESELLTQRRLAEVGRYPLEANDWGAVKLAAGRPFVAGPHLNLYNGETLALLAELGARRFVLPVELSAETLAQLQAERPAGMEAELFAWGRLPLAFSARCFTARAHHLPKDDCQFRCADYPDGLLLESQEGHPFLAMNGIQTQSAQSANLIHALPQMAQLGVDRVRLSPQSRGMEQVVNGFAEVLAGADPAAVDARLQRLAPAGTCNGYWWGQAGMDWQPPADLHGPR